MVGDPAKWKYQNYFGRVNPAPAAGGNGGVIDSSALKLQQAYNPQMMQQPQQQQQQQQPQYPQQGFSAQTQPYYGY